MAVVAVFFKLSMSVRDLHNHLVENVGVPAWASYSLFAAVTLGLGCILGFVSARASGVFECARVLRLLLVYCLHNRRRFSDQRARRRRKTKEAGQERQQERGKDNCRSERCV